MKRKVAITTQPTRRSAKRLPVFNQRGYVMRGGDWFKIEGRNNWWRFIAYVIPEGGESYIECVELKRGGREVNGGLRCIDASRVREVR